MKKIAVLVSGGGTNLQAILDAEASGIIKSGKVSLVLSSKDGAYALERAKNAGVEGIVVAKKEYPDREDYTNAVKRELEARGIDLVVLAGFMIILHESFFTAYENRVINVHPALIPSFCGEGFYGLHVHEAALAKGVKLSGATVHFVNAVCDGGPIIAQKAVAVMEGDTPEMLQRRIMEQAEWKILPEAVEMFCADRLSVAGGIVHIK
ncbi:MAG: phosphoribosylglycinamide formyltransferase [Ruminococcaceae bacterium]|nr:phosphoribosylglycinamide formyltransferase [Oscillospiraceae bacterium]